MIKAYLISPWQECNNVKDEELVCVDLIALPNTGDIIRSEKWFEYQNKEDEMLQKMPKEEVEACVGSGYFCADCIYVGQIYHDVDEGKVIISMVTYRPL